MKPKRKRERYRGRGLTKKQKRIGSKRGSCMKKEMVRQAKRQRMSTVTSQISVIIGRFWQVQIKFLFCITLDDFCNCFIHVLSGTCYSRKVGLLLSNVFITLIKFKQHFGLSCVLCVFLKQFCTCGFEIVDLKFVAKSGNIKPRAQWKVPVRGPKCKAH